ncbi:aromatic-ring-hydroxylating dioxygenase subunit beta [Pseudomonas sp. UMAB-40]|jgi:3-phenylpropionate/cinnamic acid dioxygenase small subunit|uniref:aromatic-ring-hydroxylating dioxygenase subunit beta n=1 Tax=Pseudomonas sp. UMAB-40 TaxID=1365407 RepID=UPI001C5919CF|nr:aromatic-ring-hydroxylating dioxygenase subunit beta [Pseudomonas sp. UMAB-40]
MQLDQNNKHAIEQLIASEIQLLDQQDFSAWQQLLTPDYTYWIPLRREQTSPLHESSLLYEDRFLTTLRINRLANARNYSQQPKSRSLHIAQCSLIRLEDDELSASSSTNMLYCEARGDSEWHYPVTVEHQLINVEGTWKIQGKKVLLLNPSRAIESLQLII